MANNGALPLSRFTVLDLAHRAGLLDDCLDNLFDYSGILTTPQSAAEGPA